MLALRRFSGETYELRRVIAGVFNDSTGELATTVESYTGVFGQALDPTAEDIERDGATAGDEYVAVPAAQLEAIGATELRVDDLLIRGATRGKVVRVRQLREGGGRVAEYVGLVRQLSPSGGV